MGREGNLRVSDGFGNREVFGNFGRSLFRGTKSGLQGDGSHMVGNEEEELGLSLEGSVGSRPLEDDLASRDNGVNQETQPREVTPSKLRLGGRWGRWLESR